MSSIAQSLPISAAFLALLAISGYAAWWCYSMWAHIWGPPRTAFERMVYRLGARGWGLLTWTAADIGLPLFRALLDHQSWRHAALRIVVVGVVTFPVYLWLGYWWGRMMAACFGIKKSEPAV